MFANNNSNKNTNNSSKNDICSTSSSVWSIAKLTTMCLCLLILLTYLVPVTQSIYCWQCNSAVDRFCKDVPASPDLETLDDCFKKMYRECIPENEKMNYTFCRKQVQTIDEDVRVIRACGFVRAPQDCYWTKSPPSSSLVCQCDGDGCNGAFQLKLSSPLLLLPTLLVLFNTIRMANIF